MHPVIKQRRDELEQLCSQYRVSSLSLFGSAATAQYDAANSDLDFLVEFQPLPPLIVEFTANKSFTDYQEDAMLRAAVERLLAIIGEAVAQLATLNREIQTLLSE